MSEEAITTVVKQPKPKDPRRVVAGKRLALISKEAKARKKQERENFIKEEAKSNENVLLVASVIIAFGGLLYYLKSVPAAAPVPATAPSPVVKERKTYSMDDD